MNSISYFAKAVCVVVFICVFLEELYPPGNMQKIYKYAISLFAVLSLIGSVKTLLESDFSFIKSINEAGDFSYASLDNEIVSLASENIENLAAKELIKKDIKYKNITVKMDISDESGINIDRIIVVLEDYKDVIPAKYAVEEALNIKTEVILDEGQN